MAGFLVPMLAQALGLKDMVVRNLPYGAQGIASLALNPYSAIAGPIMNSLGLPYSRLENSRSLAGEYLRRGIAEQLPQQLGDFIAPERKFDQPIADLYKEIEMGPPTPYTYQSQLSPAEEYMAREFERINRLPKDVATAELDKYMSGEKTWPSNREALKIRDEEDLREFDSWKTSDLGGYDTLKDVDVINSMSNPEFNASLGMQPFVPAQDSNYANLELGFEAPNLDLSAANFGNLGLGNLDFDAGNFDFGGFGDTGGGFFGGSDDDYFMQTYAKGGPVKRRKVVA